MRKLDMYKLRVLCAAAVLAGGLAFTAPADAGHACCQPCPPPPVEMNLCVVDPCTGCSTMVCVCVPACCGLEAPVLACCKNGLFGRKVLTYKWCNCGHEVDVVLKRNGTARVR